ncbi:uroporphyrinogen decarboxylase family protein [Chloroflexota bacterium]
MNSRERVLAAINHQEPDRVPIDLGGSIVTGIMAGALVRLRKHLGMDHKSVKVYDCFQMLGEVTDDLIQKFKIDLLPVEPDAIVFGHLKRRDWKPWTLFDGTEVLVPGAFDVEITQSGEWLLHQDGNPTQKVVAKMPKDGYYFDQMSITAWNPNYKPPSIESLKNSRWRRLDEETLTYLQAKARELRRNTDKALVLTNWGEAVLGPPTVGSLPEWLALLVTEPGYVGELFDLANSIAIENLKQYWEALGDTIDIIHMDGYDFGSQNREMFSPKIFEKFFEPCYKTQCGWIHKNTPWKTAKHCCGSITKIIEPMIRGEIDILNPVQTSASGMDAQWLKDTFGEHITFWGGGVDTQRILPFGTPEEVYKHVTERTKIMMPGGGFIWNAIHNIQYNIPPDNIIAAIQAVQDHGRYS